MFIVIKRAQLLNLRPHITPSLSMEHILDYYRITSFKDFSNKVQENYCNK